MSSMLLACVSHVYCKYSTWFNDGLHPQSCLNDWWRKRLNTVKSLEWGTVYIWLCPYLLSRLDMIMTLKKRFIRESQSPAGYSILFILKKDETLWLCVNYWGLNNIMIKNSYLLPLISELQDWLQRAKIFSKFDISGAYNWIQIKSGEEWKTAMRTCFRLYEYLIMSFELTNTLATF